MKEFTNKTDKETLDMIERAQWVHIKQLKKVDKILLLTESGKLKVSLKLRGRVKDFPDIKNAIEIQKKRKLSHLDVMHKTINPPL